MTFEEYEKQRKQELGLVQAEPDPVSPSSSSSGSFEAYESKRKMELGLIPDTRSKNIEQKKTDMYFSEDITPLALSQTGYSTVERSNESQANELTVLAPSQLGYSAVDRARENMPTSQAGYSVVDRPERFDVNDLGNDIGGGIASFLQGVPKNATAALDGMANVGTFGAFNKLLEYNQEDERIANQDSVAGAIGGMVGMVGTGELAYRGAAKLIGAGAKRLSPRITNALDELGALNGIAGTRAAGVAARGATAGTLYGTARESTEAALGEQQDFSGRLQDIGMDAALFGVGDVALAAAAPALGNYIKQFFRKTPEVAPIEPVGDPLALPLGRVTRGEQRVQAARDRSNLPYADDIIAPANDIPANALPDGNYIPQQRLRVSDNAESMLDRVMTQIKPEVEQMIAVPARRDLLVDYVQKYTEIPITEIRNMPMTSLQELGQYVRQGIDLPKLASETAAKYGHDLPALFEGRLPTVAGKVARDANARVAGVYPEQLPNVRPPEAFNVSKTSPAAAPLPTIGLRSTASKTKARVQSVQPVKPSIDVKPVTVDTPVFGTPATSAKPAVQAPKTEPAQQQRGFTETLIESPRTMPGLRSRLKTAYTRIPNETSVAQANKRVDKDLESSASYVLGKSQLNAEKVTTAHRVIAEYSKAGNFERANDVADKIAEELTRAGQSIQAASIYNRLTAEGILVHANRIAAKINDSLPITAKEVKVTPDMAARITDLAQTTQKMTGVKGLADDVINILDKAKSGDKLTETETATLRNFVNESKQFIKETARKPRPPRPPQEPKDKRVRDNVVSFLDAQEAAAKERLRARGISVSSTPLDVWADYAIIGAAKLGKKGVKFADWSESMVKDLGEQIRPQLKVLYEDSLKAYNQSKKVVTKQTISEAERLTERVIKTKELDAPMADTLRSLAQKVSGLSGDAKMTASQDLQKILQTLERPTILRRIASTQTIGQLLNLKTQARNALGNELFYRVERLNKLVATPIDIARSKITGGERTVTFRTNNQGEYWKNWMNGGKAGWDGVNINGLQTAYDLGSQAFRAKWNPLTYMEKALGASLKSFDTAAYMRAYNNTVGEMATLRAINEGKRGNKDLIQKYIREADDNVMKIADEYGKYVTFQDNNAISNTLVKAKRVLNVGKEFGIGDLVLKYPKTPGALLMRALEYSPAGFVRSASIMARPFFKKEVNTKEATEALSRAIIGTMGFSGMGYYLYDNGIITGSASKDKDVRDLQKSAGQGQYQVNLSALSRFVKSGFDTDSTKLQEDDYMYTYDWMQPVSIAVSMGANISKNTAEGKSKLDGIFGTAYNSAEGALSTLTEQSVLSGLKNATQLYPGQSVADKVVDVLTDIPSSFIPTYLNQAKQLTDNSRPETFSPDKVGRGVNKARAKIPGLAGDLPKQFDALGEEKEVYQNNSAFNVLVNPGFSSNYKLSPEAKYVVELMNESGDESVAPRVPGKTITVNGQSMQLNGDQFSRLQELQGLSNRKEISKLKGSGSLKSRVEREQDALTRAGSKAREQLVKEYPELKPAKTK